jgi:hypothetical protein
MEIVKRTTLIGILLPIAFVGSCAVLTPAAMRLADPLTHRSVETRSPEPFPILIVSGDGPRVRMVEDLRNVPALPEGATYLVTPGQEDSFQRALNESWPDRNESGWVLKVEQTAPDRQRIQLYLMGDGYWGGAYDATADSVTPRYRKTTGPGFAFIAVAVALGINTALWGLGAAALRTVKRRGTRHV